MNILELARQLAKHKQLKDAQKAYTIALQQGELTPQEELEAASYLLFSKGDYKAAYTTFVSLFNRGLFQAELLELMSQAFYFPNVDKLRRQYERNCHLLKRYPYCFRKDFIPFEDLPIWFFPYDDQSYIPYDPHEQRFGDYFKPGDPVIDRYFFKDLEKPILAQDVYSQYQLEYLNDNVRKSEWIGRENHVYLHYTNWGMFCAYLQCLSLHRILKDEKFVFLIEEEVEQYPIDFLARFGIDYSQYPVKPLGVKEINRLIWHTQFAAHNGGDFFNEIFYGHPNLLILDSLMMNDMTESAEKAKMYWAHDKERLNENFWYPLLAPLKHITEKDFLVAYFLSSPQCSPYDPGARIVPALFFQPHFYDINFEIHASKDETQCILTSKQYESVQHSPLFQRFKYIKTFTPIRRFTTSYAASTRFSYRMAMEENAENLVVDDGVTGRILNRSFMIDPDARLFHDSVLVRFEDGKLNPKATFTALTEFLDIPYDECLTYCSGFDFEKNAPAVAGNVGGFDLASVYRTYDDYADNADRAFLEYFLRDAYSYYGYSFHYYQGEPVDEAWIREKALGAIHLDACIEKSYHKSYLAVFQSKARELGQDPEQPEIKAGLEKEAEAMSQLKLKGYQENRIYVANMLQKGFSFVNKRGQPLKMMPLLKLDPALLEQPLYH